VVVMTTRQRTPERVLLSWMAPAKLRYVVKFGLRMSGCECCTMYSDKGFAFTPELGAATLLALVTSSSPTDAADSYEGCARLDEGDSGLGGL